MDMTIVLLGVVVLVAVAFFLTRKKPAELAPPETKPALPEKPKTEPAKADAKSPAKGDAPASSKSKVSDGGIEVLPSMDVLPAADSMPRPEATAPARPGKRDVAGIRKGLAMSRGGFIAKLTALVTGRKEIDPSILEQLEEAMLTSDVGVKTTQAILERLRERLQRNELADADAVWAALRAEALRILSLDGGPLRFPAKPTVVLMVGVNGVGKTTTIGKLATKFAADGRSIVLGAGDTFRAAAASQLEVWGKRVGVDVVRGKEGADPGAVAFDAATKAKEKGADLLFHDTAGRLHTKAPLMDELKKVRKSLGKALDGSPHETLLVLDATTGQNALTQAAMFKEALEITGIVLTKLDGTAKGGIVLAICDELKIPVRYIGLGERAEDLREFYADDFVEALFGKDDEVAAA